MIAGYRRSLASSISLVAVIFCTSISQIAGFIFDAPPVEAKVLQEPKTSYDKRFVDDLIAKMTLQEKLGQMNLLSIGSDVTGPVLSEGVEDKIARGEVGGVFNAFGLPACKKLQDIVMQRSRLKIPLIFGYDVIHGHKTIFPIPLGLSCSFDLDLIQKTAAAAADEATADGINWTFSPMVDICRDPRWGRVMEGAGEDPYLGSRIAEAMVRGYQGSDMRPGDLGLRYAKDKLLSCVKHFALYGAAESGRDYNTVDMSRGRMFNEYMPPYKAAVLAGAATVMTSFNEVDGIPASGNKWLITDLLRQAWGFKGFVATDYTAIPEMIAHGSGDAPQVTRMALDAGVDQDMVGEYFVKYAPDLIKEGKISLATIDSAVRRILETKIQLGLFEDPYRYLDARRNQANILDQSKMALSREAAGQSMVLLKNTGKGSKVLPLDASLSNKIAFVGPFVDDRRHLIGAWSAAGQASGKETVNLKMALDARFGNDPHLLFAKGCNILDDEAMIAKLNRDGGSLSRDSRTPDEMIAQAVKLAHQSDIVVACLGEPFAMTGEAASRSEISLPANQRALLEALKATGKPIVLVLFNGRPLTLSWEDQNMDAILETWFGGTRSGEAIVDVLFGDRSPSGKLSISFPRSVGQIPIYYNHKNTGRPFVPNEKYHSQYLDVSNEPLYPFGHGLTYGDVVYEDIVLRSDVLSPGGKAVVCATVRNKGDRACVECAQLYVRDVVGTITRPVRELKGFQRIALPPREAKTVQFEITDADLAFYGSDLNLQTEAGTFEIFVGTDSVSAQKTKTDLTYVLGK